LLYKNLKEGNVSFYTSDSNIAHKVLSSPRQNGDIID